VRGWLKGGFDVHLSHYDRPPTDSIGRGDEIDRLLADDRFRFANVLSGWAEFGDATTAGYAEDSRLLMGSTAVRVGVGTMTFLGYSLPTIQLPPVVEEDRVTLVQTVGGRTGVPLPRPVKHPPWVRWHAPIVWTTIRLVLHRDGSVESELTGASGFPRHWLYGDDGTLTHKSAMTRQKDWMDHSFGPRTPWGDQDSDVLTVEAESEIERALSGTIMRGGARPTVIRVPEGEVVLTQGQPGTTVSLVLDGVLDVYVDDVLVAELGPGAVVGERAVLEGGRRTSTVVARSAARLATVPGELLDPSSLADVAELHRREDEPE
jgi:hypothetical protein